jgi:hypothetical protein
LKILSILEFITARLFPTRANPIIARWYMSFDPISATEALKLLRIWPMMDLTIFLLAFKE